MLEKKSFGTQHGICLEKSVDGNFKRTADYMARGFLHAKRITCVLFIIVFEDGQIGRIGFITTSAVLRIR